MKVIVAHPFQQHSYYTAVALKNNNVLFKYVTSIYYKPGTFLHCVLKLLNKNDFERAIGRRSEKICDNDVRTFAELANLFLLFSKKISSSFYLFCYWKAVNVFNYKLLKYAKKNQPDAIIVFDCLSGSLVPKLKRDCPKTKVVVDFSAPSTQFVEKILNEEKQRISMAEFLAKETLFLKRHNRIKIRHNKIECAYADGFLVASEFTAESLRYLGVYDTKIYLCQYGLKTPIVKDVNVNFDRKIKVAFVGAVNMQKGAHRLLKAVKRLDADSFEFVFYGNYDSNSNYYKERPSNCFFRGHVKHEKMILELKQCDFLIFPSFADGYGFSVTEALSLGIPVLCSKNAGASQFITDSYNGWVFDPTDDNMIVEKMNFINENRNALNEMKRHSIDSVNHITWDNYSTQLYDSLEKILEG